MSTVEGAQPSPASPIGTQDGNDHVKAQSTVAKFLSRMSQAHGGIFDPKRLNSRPTRLVGSQESPARLMNTSESQIVPLSRFWTWITNRWHGENAYEAAIVKKAFSNISHEKQNAFLELAFRATVSPESLGNVTTNPPANVPANVKIVLEFCQAADVKEDAIIKSINTIPNPDVKVKVVSQLKENANFKWGDLSHTVAKDLVLGLSKCGDKGAECLELLLETNYLPGLKNLDRDEAKTFVPNLSKCGDKRQNVWSCCSYPD
jgi:hypothetical protein